MVRSFFSGKLMIQSYSTFLVVWAQYCSKETWTGALGFSLLSMFFFCGDSFVEFDQAETCSLNRLVGWLASLIHYRTNYSRCVVLRSYAATARCACCFAPSWNRTCIPRLRLKWSDATIRTASLVALLGHHLLHFHIYIQIATTILDVLICLCGLDRRHGMRTFAILLMIIFSACIVRMFLIKHGLDLFILKCIVYYIVVYMENHMFLGYWYSSLIYSQDST